MANKKETLNKLISEKAIAKRVEELSEEIANDYAGKEILLLCILKGAVFFAVDLARNIGRNVSLEFMDISSYEYGKSGNIVVNLDLRVDIEGKHVLIVEDIIDSGKTAKFLFEYLNKRKPASVKLCALLEKPRQKIFDVNADYIGFTLPDFFVVGYGLDYNQRYRNLKYIASITMND